MQGKIQKSGGCGEGNWYFFAGIGFFICGHRVWKESEPDSP